MNKKKIIDFFKSVYAVRIFFVILMISYLLVFKEEEQKDFSFAIIIFVGLLAIALSITYLRKD
ncbi:hypothetical protein [Tenacibaculum sp. 190524A05c]|uniref:hypothetical protein n=1 Tax=Tenacibaculum platacis TaxID=3137852 RepID=UPI0032B27440